MSSRFLPALVAVLALACAMPTGCVGGTVGGLASAGGFRPRDADRLTVATSDLPIPGFWTGPADAPSGGFEHELAEALAERFGLDEVAVVLVPFRDLVTGDLGGADLALAQITPTGERDRHLDFSMPYLPAPPGILVRDGTEVPDLHAAQRLDWVVQEATTLTSILREEVRPEGPAGKVASLGTMVSAVRSGRADAALLDLPTALAIADHSAGELAVAGRLPGDETLAVGLPDGSANREAVDSALRRLRSDGTLDELAERWLGRHWQGGSPEVPVVRTGA